MHITLISDGEHPHTVLRRLAAELPQHIMSQGHTLSHFSLTADNVANCIGCFGCWIKKPGECLINDQIETINRTALSSQLLIYLTPIVFGGFSAPLKNVLDRSLPNVLPFFNTRNGLTHHEMRYDRYPYTAVIGCTDDACPEEAVTFQQWLASYDLANSIHICRHTADREAAMHLIEQLTSQGGAL